MSWRPDRRSLLSRHGGLTYHSRFRHRKLTCLLPNWTAAISIAYRTFSPLPCAPCCTVQHLGTDCRLRHRRVGVVPAIPGMTQWYPLSRYLLPGVRDLRPDRTCRLLRALDGGRRLDADHHRRQIVAAGPAAPAGGCLQHVSPFDTANRITLG